MNGGKRAAASLLCAISQLRAGKSILPRTSGFVVSLSNLYKKDYIGEFFSLKKYSKIVNVSKVVKSKVELIFFFQFKVSREVS